ncbi:MAG: PAS domain S-box protein, partial [Chloroflexaceae bacterium]|nr:PAS domain S-box protein [Chloroflexaceae bacterium]
MNPYQYFLFLLVCSALIQVGFATYAWQHRNTPAAYPFVLLCVGGTIWSIGYIFELLTPTLSGKIFWDNAQFIGTDLGFIGLIWFPLSYAAYTHWNRRVVPLLIGFALLSELVVWTDPYHQLIRTSAIIDTSGAFSVLAYTYGPWFLLYTLITISAIFFSLGFLIVASLRNHHLYQQRTVIIAIGLAMPIIGVIATVGGFVPIPNMEHLDISPFATALSTPFLAWGIFRGRLFDLVPVARAKLLDQMQDGVLVINEQHHIIDINPAACAILGTTARAAIGQSAVQVLPELTSAALSGEGTTTLHLTRSDQQQVVTRWVKVTVTPLQERPHTNSSLLVLRDITAHKQAEEAYHTLVDNSLQGLNIIQDDRVVFANRAMSDINGYTLEEILNWTAEEAWAMIHPDDRAQVLSQASQQFEQQISRQYYRYRVSHKDGSFRWIELLSVPIEYRGRLAFQASFMDITERKQAEELLRASEARYRTLAENFPGAVLLFDQDMRYLVADGRELAMIGMTPAMLEGKTLNEAAPPDVAAIGDSLYRAILTGTAPRELEQRYGDQIYRTQPLSLRNDQGQIIAGMIISQNITERTRMEEDLRASEAFLRSIYEGTQSGIFLVDV